MEVIEVKERTPIMEKVKELKEQHPKACKVVKVCHTVLSVVANTLVLTAAGSEVINIMKENSKVIEVANEVMETVE